MQFSIHHPTFSHQRASQILNTRHCPSNCSANRSTAVYWTCQRHRARLTTAKISWRQWRWWRQFQRRSRGRTRTCRERLTQTEPELSTRNNFQRGSRRGKYPAKRFPLYVSKHTTSHSDASSGKIVEQVVIIIIIIDVGLKLHKRDTSENFRRIYCSIQAQTYSKISDSVTFSRPPTTRWYTYQRRLALELFSLR